MLVVVAEIGGRRLIGKQSDDPHPLQGAMPLLFEQPRAELAGPALIKMRAGGETIGGTIGGENQKEKEKVFDPKSSLSSSTASPSSGSDCGMVECSNCGLRQPLQCGQFGDYEIVDEAAVKALKVSEGFDASKNVEVQKPFAVSEDVGVAEYSDDDEHGGNCGFCGERLELGFPGEMVVPGEHTEPLQRCSWAEAELFHEIEVEEHGALKSLWMEELRKVAVGEDEGMKQGRVLEELETELVIREAHLEEQHLCLHQHRLASLSLPTPSIDGPPAELPQPVLQTYTVPLQLGQARFGCLGACLEGRIWFSDGNGGNPPNNGCRASQKSSVSHNGVGPSDACSNNQGSKWAQEGSGGGVWKYRLERVGPGDDGPAADGPQPSTSPYSTYAGGADGALLRCLVKKASCENGGVASLDVATAFLLAPRRESERQLLVMKPPKVFVDAGICGSDELWQIQHAMYGLTSSPSDWGHYRNSVLSKLQWNLEGVGYQLIQTPEPNLWKVVLKENSMVKQSYEDLDRAYGFVALYVDDVLAVGEVGVMTGFLEEVQRTWKCSSPEWVKEGEWSKFCGYEFTKKENAILLSQRSYIRDLLSRYEDLVPKSTPLPGTLDETPEENVQISDVRAAQTLVGELLWAACRSRPDLSFATSWLGRHVTRCPRRVLSLGRHTLGYLSATADMSLAYNRCEGGFGSGGSLAF